MNPSPVKKAFRFAALLVALAAILFGALVYIALNVPEDKLVREEVKNAHKAFVEEVSPLPAGLIFIREYASSNQELSVDYSDPQDALVKLNTFERQEGYSRIFAAKDRCTRTGPRYMTLYIDSTNRVEQAGQYYQYVKAENALYTQEMTALEMGDEAYRVFSSMANYCSDSEQEVAAVVAFRRGRYLVTLSLSGAETAYQPEALLEMLLPIAAEIDQRLAQAGSN